MKAEVYWVESGTLRLGVLPRPRGGDWVFDEVASLRAQGIDLLVSLLTADERTELQLEQEEDACRRCGVEFVQFPIEDRGVPSDAPGAAVLVKELYHQLRLKKAVGVHCRMGIGRSAMIAAAILTLAGHLADEAFAGIEAARGCKVPDTAEQRAWVMKFARTNLLPHQARGLENQK